jgi:hypothetical protein
MYRVRTLSRILVLVVAGTIATATFAQHATPAASASRAGATSAPPPPNLQPEAIVLLQTMSAKLAAAQSMSFTAAVTNEAPSRIGPALAYTTLSEVAMQRPNKLRVVTWGDGAASEFYYDGKTMTAYAPVEKLAAVAAAPPTLEGMLKQAYDSAAIYFPYDDLMAADPYKNIADVLTVAFVIGQSKAVGGVTTDVLAIASDTLFLQLWIGADDKLPRRMRATFRGDPVRLRHQLDLSNWKLDPVLAAETFASLDAAKATRIDFAPPQPTPVTARNAPVRMRAGKATPAAQ